MALVRFHTGADGSLIKCSDSDCDRCRLQRYLRGRSTGVPQESPGLGQRWTWEGRAPASGTRTTWTTTRLAPDFEDAERINDSLWPRKWSKKGTAGPFLPTTAPKVRDDGSVRPGGSLSVSLVPERYRSTAGLMIQGQSSDD